MTEREEFVQAALRGEIPFAHLCGALGISRRVRSSGERSPEITG